jgi:chromosome segregation ATPase
VDALSDLKALEQRDAELAARGERLREASEEASAIRSRAEEIDAFFAAYGEAETRARGALAAAERDLDARRAELAAAQSELADAQTDDARSAAERAVARAHDHLEIAEGRVARAVAARDELEREAASLPEELPSLAARAAAVADGGAPGDAPRELADWAARAQASLFVAAGQLDSQRERIIREANELATMLLGEPTYGATPAQARARVEATLR